MSELSSHIEPGSTGPVYDRSRPLVQRLEAIAFHLPMIRLFQALRLAETAEGVLPEAASTGRTEKISSQEIKEVYLADEARLRKRREYVATHHELADAMTLLSDWYVYENEVALENFYKAYKAYHRGVLSWPANDLAALHTIWSARQLWESGCDNPSAAPIRQRAIELWEQTELLSPGNPCENKLRGVNWSRLFDDLGIPAKFSAGVVTK